MILLTGGAGYIGSHTLLALLQRGDNVVVLDNLSTGSIARFQSVCNLAGSTAEFVHGDIRDTDLLNSVFSQHDIDAVVHMAGLKSVSQSVVEPLNYYDNNIVGSINLLKFIRGFGVNKLLFASSLSAGTPSSPYAQSKCIIDGVLKAMAASDDSMGFASLRYSNPIGCYDAAIADTSPDNLLPTIMRVVKGKQSQLTIFGDDYDTPDGTAMRDYVHILDVVDATLLALDYLSKNKGYYCWQVGLGVSVSVKQLLSAFEKQMGCQLPYNTVKLSRQGDVASCGCNIDDIKQALNWTPKFGVGGAIESLL